MLKIIERGIGFFDCFMLMNLIDIVYVSAFGIGVCIVVQENAVYVEVEVYSTIEGKLTNLDTYICIFELFMVNCLSP